MAVTRDGGDGGHAAVGEVDHCYVGIWYHGMVGSQVALSLMEIGELQLLDGTAANGTAVPLLLWSSNTSRAARAGATTCVYPGLRQPPVRNDVVGQLLAPDGHGRGGARGEIPSAATGYCCRARGTG